MLADDCVPSETIWRHLATASPRSGSLVRLLRHVADDELEGVISRHRAKAGLR